MAEPNQSTAPPPEAQQEIAQAAAETAAAGGSQEQVAAAAQTEARKQGYELTDEQAKALAGQLAPLVTAGVISEFEKRGVFREEPEPVAPPPVSTEEPATPPAPADAVPEPRPDAAPQKRSWADRHFG